jgi:hypothetical protein
VAKLEREVRSLRSRQEELATLGAENSTGLTDARKIFEAQLAELDSRVQALEN